VNWSLVNLEQVAEVNPRLRKTTDDTQKVSFVAMASVSEQGFISNQVNRILSETKKGFTYFKKNDVLLAKITPCFENGKAAIADNLENEIGFGSTEFHVLRGHEDKLDNKYLFYLIWNDKFRFIGKHSMKGAAGQKRVSADFLKNLKIPLPPLKEQKRIATILDKADKLCRKRQQAIQLADEFLRSVFLDMFGDPVTNPKEWEKQSIKFGITSIQAGWSAKGADYPCSGDKLGVLKISSVTSGKFKSQENKFVDKASIPQGKNLIFPKKGDLLFSRANTRELVAATCIVTNDYNHVFLPDKLWSIKVSDRFVPEFLHYLIKHPVFKGILTSQATGTSGSMLK